MTSLPLDRPLAVFDIESTGLNRKTDRIIDLAVVKIPPHGPQEHHEFLVNPGMPIPPDSTEVHGITDEKVKHCPPFSDVAPGVAKLLEGCDLGGFNILHFDIPLLMEEFSRVGVAFSMEGRRVLDAQRIFHRKEPRDLSAALSFYCGEMHLEAHSAIDDVLATIRVIDGQVARYPDLPQDMEQLSEYCNPRDPSWADQTGRLKWRADEVVINFGKNQGRPLRELVMQDTGFLNWILKSDFPRDTQDIIRNALSGRLPSPPPKEGEHT